MDGVYISCCVPGLQSPLVVFICCNFRAKLAYIKIKHFIYLLVHLFINVFIIHICF